MAKVKEVQANQVRKKHKCKDKSKKPKSKRPKTNRTALKQAQSQPVEPSPNAHVQRCTINESADQPQLSRQRVGKRGGKRGSKRRHKSIPKSQPSNISHSHLVRIAEYVRLAHEAVGRTATTMHTKHLRISIKSGISVALKEAQDMGTPEQFIEQKLRNKVLECINSKSPYTKIKQVLVSLDNFIQALHVQVAVAQQSPTGQDKDQYRRASEPAFAGFATQNPCVIRNKMSNGEQRRSYTLNDATRAEKLEISPGEEQEKVLEEAQNHGFELGHVHCTRPQDSQGQWNKNTTFSRDIILVVRDRNVLVHLRAMNQEDFLSIVDSAFQKVSPHSNSSRAFRWLSHATITDSGNVKVSVHTKDPKELDTLTEEMTTGWARTLHNEAKQSSRVFEVLVPNFPIDPTNLDDPDRRTETIERLVRNNASRIPSLTRLDDIRDVQTAKSEGRAGRGTAIILVFNSCQLANNVIENGLDWNGEHHRCEALGASELLEQCERCQLYTHTANSCTNTVRCGKCGEPHFTRFCKSIDFACAVCSGLHPASSEACPARNAARDEIQKVRFALDSEEDDPQLITSCTHLERNLSKAAGLQGKLRMKEAGPTSSHPHSKEVLEKMRCLRQEVIAFEKELTSGLESRDQRTASIGVPGKKLKNRSNVSGKAQQASVIGRLPAPSNGKHESHKRKPKEHTAGKVQPEAAFDNKRIKREDSAFDQFGYQWTPGYHDP